MADEYTPRRDDASQPPRRGDEFDLGGGGDFRHRDPSGGGGGGGGGGGDGNAVIGWVIFILIFGVGNVILYNTTGIVIIPFGRR